MYKWITSNVWPGPDLLQEVSSLVLKVDLLMIFFKYVKGPVESIYCRQRMFLSCWMIFFQTKNVYNLQQKTEGDVKINNDIHWHSVCGCDVVISGFSGSVVCVCVCVCTCVCMCVCVCLWVSVGEPIQSLFCVYNLHQKTEGVRKNQQWYSLT